jgi:hypothetical protein
MLHPTFLKFFAWVVPHPKRLNDKTAAVKRAADQDLRRRSLLLSAPRPDSIRLVELSNPVCTATIARRCRQQAGTAIRSNPRGGVVVSKPAPRPGPIRVVVQRAKCRRQEALADLACRRPKPHK